MSQSPLAEAGAAQQQPLAVQMFLDDPNKSVIFDTPASNSNVTLSNPKISNPFYEATQLDQAGDKPRAKAIYNELLNANFDNCVLFAALGMLYCTISQSGIAKLLLDAALRGIDSGHLIPDFKALGVIPKCETPASTALFTVNKRAEVLNALGTCFKHENRVPEAREHFLAAQALVDTNADIQNNLGTLYINEGRPEKALEHLDLSISVQSDHAQAHWNRSLAWLEMGDYEKGFPEYDYGFPAKVRIERNYAKFQIPQWDGTPGKNLIIHGEQGIGDEIMFMSMFGEVCRDAKSVVLECHRGLHELFAASFPNVDIYPTREDQMLTWPLKADGTPRYNFDAKCSIGSLGQFYRRNISDFPGKPFLRPSGMRERLYAERLAALGPRPKIGISWIGGHKRTRVEVRSMELMKMLPILEIGRDKVDWISLQYTPSEHELAEFERETGIKIHHWPDCVYNQNYDHTAGLVSNLDLVISVCTSVIHLAGALGVPCWIMTPSRPAWRYRLDINTMPWYQSNILFRQAPDSTDWTPVIAEVSAALIELLGAQ